MSGQKMTVGENVVGSRGVRPLCPVNLLFELPRWALTLGTKSVSALKGPSQDEVDGPEEAITTCLLFPSNASTVPTLKHQK